MSQTFQARVDAIDQEVLAPLVRQALQSPEAEVVEWRYVPLGEGGGQGILGRLCVSGQARVQDEVVPWSLVSMAR
jgi:hypothetical protein